MIDNLVENITHFQRMVYIVIITLMLYLVCNMHLIHIKCVLCFFFWFFSICNNLLRSSRMWHMLEKTGKLCNHNVFIRNLLCYFNIKLSLLDNFAS